MGVKQPQSLQSIHEQSVYDRLIHTYVLKAVYKNAGYSIFQAEDLQDLNVVELV